MSPEKYSIIGDYFSTNQSRMTSFVRSLISDTADRDSEDIVQDVMVSILDSADITIPLNNLAAYIFSALRNRVIDIFRKKENTISIDASIYNEDGVSLKDLIGDIRYEASTEVQKQEIYDDLYRLIDSLNEDERVLIIMTEFEGRSFREISENLSIPIGTLLSRKKRALEKIKRKWSLPYIKGEEL